VSPTIASANVGGRCLRARPIIPTRISRPYGELAARYDDTIGLRNFHGTRKAFEVLARRYGIRFRSAADIGCGTGLFPCYLNRRWGVPVFGVDISENMLRVARSNCCSPKVMFLRQDIRALRLPTPVDLVTANFDTLNHILTERGVQLTFQHIAENLHPGGHFIFDLLTPCQNRRVYTIRMRPAPAAPVEFMQQIRWDPMRHLLFTRVSFRKRDSQAYTAEFHVERAYSLPKIARWLGNAGFVTRAVLDATTLNIAAGCPPRIIVVARKSRRGLNFPPASRCP
jgi:SAM-dependent methyltransferase